MCSFLPGKKRLLFALRVGDKSRATCKGRLYSKIRTIYPGQLHAGRPDAQGLGGLGTNRLLRRSSRVSYAA